jgi:hypothetical protein
MVLTTAPGVSPFSHAQLRGEREERERKREREREGGEEWL